MIPDDDIAHVADAQRRFNDAIAGLTDVEARRPTLCPGWTVGHLLTHVARNADSHVRRAHAAVRGEVIEQYPGGYEGRASEIEAGAHRTAAELVDDVYASADALRDAWAKLPIDAWDSVTRDVGGRERPLRQLVGRRWQELEVHLIDLDLGITYHEWPDTFVTAWLPRLRLYAGDIAASPSGLDDHEQLAWLYGRLSRPDLPTPPAWG